MNTISLNNLWNYLQGLSLTASNQRWLGERLIEASRQTSASDGGNLVFPRIPKDFKPSDETMRLSAGPLPEGTDVEKVLDEMWEEWAR